MTSGGASFLTDGMYLRLYLVLGGLLGTGWTFSPCRKVAFISTVPRRSIVTEILPFSSVMEISASFLGKPQISRPLIAGPVLLRYRKREYPPDCFPSETGTTNPASR